MDRVAVVTGANRGLGLETCRQLAEKGLTVLLTSRNTQQGYCEAVIAPKLEKFRKVFQEDLKTNQ